jgi:hypothetical protein
MKQAVFQNRELVAFRQRNSILMGEKDPWHGIIVTKFCMAGLYN